MFAIIEVGGKQYKVAANDEIYVEKLTNKVGDKVKLDKVLMIDDKVGTPYIEGAYVECVVDKQGKQRKLTIIHNISKKHHTRKYGHRQPYTKLIVKTIKA